MAATKPSTMSFITEASVAEASFYSLAYVTALQQCVHTAYGPALQSSIAGSAARGVHGDSVSALIVQCRLETEREATEQLTAALLSAPPQPKPRTGPRVRLSSTDEAAAAARPSGAGLSAGTRPHTTSGASRPGSRASSAHHSHGASARPSALSRGGSPAEPFTKDAAAAAAHEAQYAPARSGPTSSYTAALSSPTHSGAAALLLLRVGLCRALGWPMPHPRAPLGEGDGDEGDGGSGGSSDAASVEGAVARKVATQVADVLLSRQSHPSVITSQRVAEPGEPGSIMTTVTNKSVHMFMQLADTELRQSVILEWLEDALLFTLYEGFTALQAQCVLLDSLLVLNLVDGSLSSPIDAEAADATTEQRVAEGLQEVLCAQTCPTAARTIDTVQRYEPVTIQVPDPAQLAEINEKLQKATSQKAVAALEAAKQGIPQVTQTVMRYVDVEVEKDVTLPAVFSMAEAAAVTDFITRSAVMHRQLWSVLLAPTADGQVPAPPTAAAVGLGRPVLNRSLCAAIENVPPIFVPPLASFFSEALQSVVDAQRQLYNACAAERATQFAQEWQRPLLAITAHELEERRVLETAEARVNAEDRAAALTVQQCVRVERAYGLRLEDALQHNTRVLRGASLSNATASAAAAAAEAAMQAAAAASAVPLPPPTAAGAGGSNNNKAKKTKSGPSLSVNAATALPTLSTEAAASIALPIDSSFALADVVARVDRIATAVDTMAGAQSPSAATRVGKGKH